MGLFKPKCGFKMILYFWKNLCLSCENASLCLAFSRGMLRQHHEETWQQRLKDYYIIRFSCGGPAARVAHSGMVSGLTSARLLWCRLIRHGATKLSEPPGVCLYCPESNVSNRVVCVVKISGLVPEHCPWIIDDLFDGFYVVFFMS